MEINSFNDEENISKLLERSVTLFKRTGLNDLAIKNEKILKNYTNAMSRR